MIIQTDLTKVLALQAHGLLKTHLNFTVHGTRQQQMSRKRKQSDCTDTLEKGTSLLPRSIQRDSRVQTTYFAVFLYAKHCALELPSSVFQEALS